MIASVDPLPVHVGLCGETGRREMGALTVGGISARIAQRDFAKLFRRGKLNFTGDVLQVISVVVGQQKFAKLLKRLHVGA
jgi:hypothetical protein